MILAGSSATAFLLANGAIFRGAAAAGLTAVFAATITALAPRSATALYRGSNVVLHLRQAKVFPSSSWVVTDAAGTTIAILRRPFTARLGRDRWTISRDARVIAEAREDSRWPARRRPLSLTSGGLDCALIRRKERTLEITSEILDTDVCLALAVVIFGGEK